MIGKPLSEIGMKSPTRQQEINIDREMLRELSYDTDKMVAYVVLNEPLLNIDQQAIYHEFLRRYYSNGNGIIFIDAPGGTGKTFLVNLLLALIRGEKKIAHSTLQIPIDLIHNEAPVCNIKNGTGKAKVLQEAKALFWDEISMMHKHGIEAVNRTLQDIRGNKNVMILQWNLQLFNYGTLIRQHYGTA